LSSFAAALVVFNLNHDTTCLALFNIKSYIPLLNSTFQFHVIAKSAKLLIFVSCCLLTVRLTAQPSKVSKMITVRDGLPQSYVSGIVQDKEGFLWIATLNGFSRYDGRGFKKYWHSSTDSAGLSSNIILHLLDVGHGQLLLCYMDGGLDLFQTQTEKVIHLGNQPSFGRLKNESSFFRSFITNKKGLCWMIAVDGGINQIDIHQNTLEHFTPGQLKLQEPIWGLAFQKDRVLLFTPTTLSVREKINSTAITFHYPFKIVTVANPGTENFFLPWTRDNGDLFITDLHGITIWNPVSNTFKQLLLPRKESPGKIIPVSDSVGNYFFEYEGGVWLLRPGDSIIAWSPAVGSVKGIPTSMYIDHSGVLWQGTNGYGLRQYNLSKSGIPGYTNQHSFVMDVLSHYGVGGKQSSATFLTHSAPFANRMATWKDQVWIADIYHKSPWLQLVLFDRRGLTVKTFHREDSAVKKETRSIKFINYDKNGVLWGIDQGMHLLRFNTDKHTYIVYPKTSLDPGDDINGLIPDTKNVCYISNPNSLIRFNFLTGSNELLTKNLPSKDLLSISNDPDDTALLWIGTLSDGLIRFNKFTRETQVYNITTGLPNNTIYSIIPSRDHELWCSSNKGVFAFNKITGGIRSFTSRDGLIDDEFNRYYYMMLPDTSMAFGGSMGYTIFKPETLKPDEFDPLVALTGFTVSDLPQLPAPLTQLTELRLSHNQNFITASFAAMQFDFPDKIQYRYQLTGFDKDWIITGNENKVSYTNLPPGNYTLLLNASNTSGKWSSHVLSIHILIAPPFWKTWWFYLITAMALCLLIYGFLNARIRSVKKAQARQMQFEREAMELHAMALRAQMNPHFIFNCLNSIKALIQEKQNKHAVKYLTTFVSLIRKQLDNTSNQVALTDELQTCKLYLEMEAMRFDGRIDFHFDIAVDELLNQVLVPPLTLQAVVENAVIHGLLPSEAGGRVDIKVYSKGDQVNCEIKDNGIGRAAAAILKEKSSPLHQSKGIHLLQERITLNNLIHKQDDSFQTIDLHHANGQSAGTLVILKFKKS
jgi:ligand-binding sensor domain-containing protein